MSTEEATGQPPAGSPIPDDGDVIAAVRTLSRLGRFIERTDSGLSLPQFRLLSLLAAGDESSTALAQRLAVSKPTISNAVDTLVEQGHLRRRSDTGDRRVTWLQITASGQAALGRAERAYLDRMRPVLARLGDPTGVVASVAALAAALDADRAARRATDLARRAQADPAAERARAPDRPAPSQPSTSSIPLKGAVTE